MLSRIRKAIAARFEALAEIAGLLLSLGGTAVASLLGKLLLAVILGTIGMGIFFRLAGRRKKAREGAEQREPSWLAPMASVVALIETAVLADAIGMPLRFHQPGFALYHWLIIAVAGLAAAWLQLQLFRRVRASLAARHRA